MTKTSGIPASKPTVMHLQFQQWLAVPPRDSKGLPRRAHLQEVGVGTIGNLALLCRVCRRKLGSAANQ